MRQAALTAGIAYLLMPVSFAEFFVNPRIMVPGDVEKTVSNIVAHGKLFVVAILCYFVTLVLDVVIAWALYYLLAPVNRALSLLTAWFRLMYTAIAFVALLNLTNLFRLLTNPVFAKAFGTGPLHAQALLFLNSYRYEWSVSLVVFAIHLGLLGWLIVRSGYVPAWIGVLLVLDAFGWVVYPLKPYLYPTAPIDFLPLFGFVGLVFPLWLVVRGWKIPEREAEPIRGSETLGVIGWQDDVR